MKSSQSSFITGRHSESHQLEFIWVSQMALVVKKLSANARDTGGWGSILGSGKSPGGRHGNPLQYSCLENPMDWRAWQATVPRISKSWTWLKRLSRHAQSVISTLYHGPLDSCYKDYVVLIRCCYRNNIPSSPMENGLLMLNCQGFTSCDAGLSLQCPGPYLIEAVTLSTPVTPRCLQNSRFASAECLFP